PKSQGGQTTWENVVVCCVECNGKKGGQTPKQAGMKLSKTPQRPKWNLTLKVTIGIKHTPESWRDYLYWNAELL
ncbi:MAG: HNH endonuclease, partial [Candidatus Vecturithrix sp.]|nr:HNH endonuclease [Candidatus Vecturithrix sp.]